MPTIKLTPSAYSLSNTSYLSVSNASNMYTDCDSETYATCTNSRSSTTSYYIYINGFNFDSVPSNATVSSFTVRFKVRESGVTTSTSYRPYLVNGTTTITGTANMPSTTATTISFTGVTATWDTVKGYGSNFGIRITNRRASSGTTGYLYIYGAEIEVEYTIPTPRTITTSLTGEGAISPSGSNTYYDDDEFELTITPTDKSAEVSVTKDGIDVTSQLTAHYGGGSTDSAVLGTYTLVSGSFNGSGASYFQGLVGNGSNASTTTSNYYSGGSSTIAVWTYDMGFTLPSNATLERVWCDVSGHAESTSQSNEYMCAMLISGSTELTDELNFKSVGTSNSVQTLECETLPTVAQLASMKLQCRLGYYGGAINGATAYVTYSIPSEGGPEYYTLAFTVSGDSTIAVVIGSSGPEMYVKDGSSWVQVSAAYVKANGAWSPIALDSAFTEGVNYVKA